MFKVNKELSGQIIRSTNALHVGDIYAKGVHYYVKPDNEKKEVLAYDLGRFAKLNVVPYESIKVRDHFYSVSKDLKENGSFLLAEDVLGSTNNIQELLSKMRKLTIYQEEMEFDFYRMYFFDFLFLNSDRYPRNFGFWKVQGEWKLVMFDHMCLFDVKYPLAMRFNDDHFQKRATLESYYLDFEEFLSFLSQDVFEEFQNMVDLYSLDVVRNEIKRISPNKENEYMMIYTDHYERVKKLLNRGVKYGR